MYRDVVGAVHLPLDGQCDPANIAMALAKGARQRGAKIVENVKVTKVHTRDGRVTGVSWAQGDEQGTIETDIVVNCAGMWARELGATDRRHHPAACLRAFLSRHRGDPRPDPPARAARAGRVRLLQGRRRQDDARRLRAGRQALGHGRHSAKTSASTSCRRTSSISSRSWKWASTACRCSAPPASTPSSTVRRALPPTTATISAKRRNLAATGWRRVTIRSASSRPAAPAWRWRNGSTMARRRSISGRSISAAPSRSRRTAAISRSASSETLGLLYADHFPYRQMATSRGVRRSPLHEHLKARGAVFGEVAGWERANWFARPGQEREYRYSWKRQNWFDNQRDEHLAVRNGVGLFDMTSFGKIRDRGPRRAGLPAAALRQRHGRARRAGSSTRRC